MCVWKERVSHKTKLPQAGVRPKNVNAFIFKRIYAAYSHARESDLIWYPEDCFPTVVCGEGYLDAVENKSRGTQNTITDRRTFLTPGTNPHPRAAHLGIESFCRNLWRDFVWLRQRFTLHRLSTRCFQSTATQACYNNSDINTSKA